MFTYCRQTAIYGSVHLLQMMLVNYIHLPPIYKCGRQYSHIAETTITDSVHSLQLDKCWCQHCLLQTCKFRLTFVIKDVQLTEEWSYLMLMSLRLTYIWNSAVLMSSFPREYCNWALHVMYYNMSRFRVTREVKFRSSCCIFYLWKIKAMTDFQCVPQTPCVENMLQPTVTKFRLRNVKLLGKVSS